MDYWPDLYYSFRANEGNGDIINSYEEFAICGLENLGYLYKNVPYDLQDSDFDEYGAYYGNVPNNGKLYIGNGGAFPRIASGGDTLVINKIDVNGEIYYSLNTSNPK